MNTILQLATPPLLGAFIGYMTNYVAIRMLFRPLRPWTIAGVRVPMTPGVIPSKRHQLARNIGEMVGEHLLTGEDVSRTIAGEAFQGKLHELIDERLATMLQKELGPVATVIPKRFLSYFKASIRIIRLRFISQMHSYLDSPTFAAIVDQAVGSQLEELLAKEVGRIFPADNEEHFFLFLEKTIHQLLAAPETRQWIADRLREWIDTVLREQRSAADLLPEELTRLLLDRMEQEAPSLLEKLGLMLRELAMQEKIGATICSAISGFTASLGPLAAMMTSFINPETIRTKVKEYLAAKGGEISRWLEDEAVRRETAAMLRRKSDELLHLPISELVRGIDPGKISALADDFSRDIATVLARSDTAASLSGLLRQVLLTQKERPLAAVLTDLFGSDAVTRSRAWSGAEITKLFRSPRVKRLLDAMIVEMVEKKLLAKPIGRPADLLPLKIQRTFSEYIRQQVSDILVREVPGLVDSLNIKKIVTRKVDGLDLLRLEGLLMSIMQEQFKYINLFGGLLGFLIGLLNLLLLGL